MLVLRELSKTFLRNTEKLPLSHIFNGKSNYFDQINEVARMLKMKQLMASFTQFIKAYG